MPTVIHEWVQPLLLVVLTIISVGRWVEARSRAEAATATDLEEYEKQHKDEHARLWEEINRNRAHWHQDMVPWQQQVVERLAKQEGCCQTHNETLNRLQTIIDRRISPRDP